MFTSLQADILIGSESWRNSSIKLSKVFPDGATAIEETDLVAQVVVYSFLCQNSLTAVSLKN